MKRLNIYCGKTLAGVLIQHAANDYEFEYDADYQTSGAAPLSPTLPLTGEAYRSDHLFPFFFNLLPKVPTNAPCAALCALMKTIISLSSPLSQARTSLVMFP